MKTLLLIVVLISSIPAGFILSWLTKEELKAGKKWFVIVIIASLILGFITLKLNIYYLALTFLYILIVTGICWKKA